MKTLPEKLRRRKHRARYSTICRKIQGVEGDEEERKAREVLHAGATGDPGGLGGRTLAGIYMQEAEETTNECI